MWGFTFQSCIISSLTLSLNFHTRNRWNAVPNPCSPKNLSSRRSVFLHLCCVGLISEVLTSDQPAMQATRQRVHCVLLIVQPLECADDAGFTLVQSHCCTRHSGPVRLPCSHSYFYTRYTSASLSVMQSFWGPCQQWYYQEPLCGSTATPQTDE